MRSLLVSAAVATAAAMSVFSASAFSAESASQQKASVFVLCKNKKDVRTIRILTDSRGSESCTISYTKGGVEEIVAVNRYMSSCTSILKNIQTNLERSNYSCRGVPTAKVISGSEVNPQ